MITTLATKVFLRLRNIFVRRIQNRYYRYHLALSCRYYGIQLHLGQNVNFYHPVRVWGTGGRITIKDNVSFAFDGGSRWYGPNGFDMRSPDAEVQLHENCIIMRGVQFVCFHRITVGAYTTIGNAAVLLDSDVHDFTPGAWEKPVLPKPIHLGERVRICPEVTILKGVSVGDDTVIGNKSVVMKPLPSRCLAAGNPARVFLIYPPVNPPSSTQYANAAP